MSSVRELETRNAVARKKLMQAVSHHLEKTGIKCRIIQEPDIDSLGISLLEPAIQLEGRRVDSIRLGRVRNSSCGDAGQVLRFQYKLKPEKEIPPEFIPALKARAEIIKEGKVLGLFGGKITGIKWTGQKLADILNRDSQVMDGLLPCAHLWGKLDIEISAVSSSEINIWGPWFANPDAVRDLITEGDNDEEQHCFFGFATAERIAQLIQETVLNIKPALSHEKEGDSNQVVSEKIDALR